MYKPVVTQEEDLAKTCPLYRRDTDGLEACAFKLARTALISSHDGRPMTLEALRNKYVELWNKLTLPDGSKPPAAGPYWEGPRASRRVARTLFGFLRNYKVLQPDETYNLVIGGYTIQGRYALVRRSEATPVEVLSCYAKEPLFKASPDMQSLARLYHARNAHFQYKDMGLIYLPLLRGDVWHHRSINERLVRTWLESTIAVAAMKPAFPIAGKHCTSCNKPCLEVFNERRHEDRRY